jgi:DNA-binding beta-propeller fold protein YncE
VRPAAARARPLVYVPNSMSNTIDEIDPGTGQKVHTFGVGRRPQHVVPSWDLKTLWVNDNDGDTLTPIDPATGKEGVPIAVEDPYNLYFTPDGRYAIVVAEKLERLEFRDATTMQPIASVKVDCKGLNHLEFTVDDRYAIATCEFSARLVKIDLEQRRAIGYLDLPSPSMPQDIRSSPDGSVFYVADMLADGVFTIDPAGFRRIGFIGTGPGTHGITVGRGGSPFYITNRGWHRIPGGRRGPGSVSVLDPVAGKVTATWPIPGGGSPDMGNVTADGQSLWVSGRYDAEVYEIDTRTGRLLRRIPVGLEPHGVCVWPQPGRFSLGHTGNMR